LKLENFCESKKYDVDIQEMTNFKQRMNWESIETDDKTEGSCIWSINRGIALLKKSLIPEITFLYSEIN